MESKNSNSKLSSEQKIDKNVTRKRVSNLLLWLVFIPFFTMKKVNGFSMSMKKISSGLVVRYFERKSTEG